MDWRDGILQLLGYQALNLQFLTQQLEEIKAMLEQQKKEGHKHEEEGLGFPGTPSFEDGPEQDVT